MELAGENSLESPESVKPALVSQGDGSHILSAKPEIVHLIPVSLQDLEG